MASKPPEQALAEQGLREATDRLQRRLNASEDPLIPFAEVLSWAYSLEEWHRRRLGSKVYFNRRDRSPDGQVTAGVMYARGLITHSLAIVGNLVTYPARTFRMSGGRRGGGVTISSGGSAIWQWRAFVELPAPGKPEAKGRDMAYQRHVQHQALVGPLQASERFLVDEIARTP